MKWLCTFVFGIIFLFSTIEGIYPRNPYVDEALWNDLEPYFLPEDMPVKAKLDKIFTASRVTQNLPALKVAGFKIPRLRKFAKVIVAKHPKVKGYVLKLFTDDNYLDNEWFDWKRRILGAHYIQETIDRLGYQHLFKVPKKWIYPLPTEPGPTPGSIRKNFILVVEDMRIFSSSRNLSWWKSVAMTEELMDSIYIVFQECGLADSVYPDNLCFSRDRKMAFVDTQHFTVWPVPFFKLLPYFSSKKQQYWQSLMDHGGPVRS